MEMQGLGVLLRHQDIPEWLESAPVHVALFPGKPLPFVLESVETDPHPAEFHDAIQAFLGKTVRERLVAAPHIFRNFCEFKDAVDEEDCECAIGSEAEVWSHLRATEVRILRRPYGDKKVYVQVTAECEWEIEHGLQLVYREGRELCRVSEQDGHLTFSDAYADPSMENRIS